MKWCHPSTLDCLYHAYMDKYYLVVLFGGRSAEHHVSCVSARHVLTAADPDRYEIIPVGIDKEGKWSLSSSSFFCGREGARAGERASTSTRARRRESVPAAGRERSRSVMRERVRIRRRRTVLGMGVGGLVSQKNNPKRKFIR